MLAWLFMNTRIITHLVRVEVKINPRGVDDYVGKLRSEVNGY